MPDPVIDPATGKPVDAPPTDPPATVAVPTEEWNAIKARVDAFESVGMRFNQPPPAAPATPPGPSFADQIKEIDTQIATLNTQIDDAVKDGKPVSTLLNERDTLTHRRTRLQIKHEDIDPAMNAGIQTIDQLSEEISRGKMKHYDLVKDDVEAALAGLTPEQRMSPQMRKAAYDIAVGKNIDKIMEAQKEEILRKAADTDAAGNPPANNSRSADAGGEGDTPKPEDILSKGALAAIRSKGVTVDEYYKKLGHKDGWKGYYEKHKDYFEEQAA